MSRILDSLRHAQAQGLARIDAQILHLHVLGQPLHQRAWLLAHDTDPMPAETSAHLQALVQRRLAGEPLAYITGRKGFYGLELHIDARVLDPRPDTETLVDWALNWLPEDCPVRVLDLGTGSGAIALALQAQRPCASVWAVDASADALAVARANADRLQLPVQFVQSHWLQGVSGKFDMVVSNPPYIAEHDAHLPALRHEPLQALVSGADGLGDLRAIVAQAPAHLHAGGALLLEHGHDQAAAVRALFDPALWCEVQTRPDLAGIGRCTGAKLLAKLLGQTGDNPRT